MIVLLTLLACSGGGDTGPTTPTFTAIQADILTPSCAFSTCHGGGSPAQGLDLTEGAAYDAIVGVPSTLDTSLALVEPGDAQASYLYLKSAGQALGDAMPPPTGLEADRLANLAAWIDAGAPND